MARPYVDQGEGSVMASLFEAGLIPELTHRVVIDLRRDAAAKMYIECYGSDALKQVGLADVLMGITPIAVQDGEVVGIEEEDDGE